MISIKLEELIKKRVTFWKNMYSNLGELAKTGHIKVGYVTGLVRNNLIRAHKR